MVFKILSKVFKFKKAYAASKGDINNTEKVYDDLVLNINKTIDDVFYKNADNGVSEKDKNIFQEAKKLFNLRVKIYKKLFFERQNLGSEETKRQKERVIKNETNEKKSIIRIKAGQGNNKQESKRRKTFTLPEVVDRQIIYRFTKYT